MPTKVLIVFHSLYTHVYHLAEAVAAGAREVPDTEVVLAQVAETLPHEVLEKMHAVEAKKSFAHVPVADPHALAEADAVILGTPTRYGSASASMQAFLDATGGLWVQGRSSARSAAPSPAPPVSTAARRRPSSTCTPSSTTRGWWSPASPTPPGSC